MNFKSRIKKIERRLFIGKGEIDFEVLLKPEFIYKGKPFKNLDDLFEGLNVVEQPPYTDFDEEVILIEKGLISLDSEMAEDVRQRIADEMRKNI